MAEQRAPVNWVEKMHADQRDRWQQGEPVLVEDYLERHPELQADSEGVLQLLTNEVILRQERHETPRLEEYVRRFPHFTPQLRDLFEVCAALGSSALLGANDSASPTGPAAAPPATAARRPAVPGYEILGVLGRGGMGVVYQARQEGLNRVVALKMLLASEHAGPEELKRFRAEAEAQARLQHPHIVQIHEIGEAEGRPYFALEYVNGGSLAQALNGTPQPARAAAELLETLARAMHHAHQHGVIHRDVKPANVLLQEIEGSEETAGKTKSASFPDSSLLAPHSFSPKITDFGLAKRLGGEAGLTRTGDVVGTPAYMAPEQASGKVRAIGPAADIYALGAILYEMLTGRPPFLGETPLDTLLQVQSQEPVPVRRLQPKVPRDLETICLKCLDKEPSQRYADAEALAQDLRRWLQGEPIQARPTRVWVRGLKWARRRPAVATLLAVSGAAAVALLAVILGYSARLHETNTDLTGSLAAEAKRRTQTRAALDLSSSAVIDDWLARQKELLPEHKKFLEQMLNSYEELARDTGQDELSRAGVARAHWRVGNIRMRLGQTAEAHGAYLRSRELYQQLLADFPTVPAYMQELAQSHNSLGILLGATGRAEDAERAHRDALKLQQQLAADFPSVPAYRRELATSYNDLGTLLQSVGRAQDAERAWRDALELYHQLADVFPSVPEYRRELAGSYNNLGNLLADTGRPQEAERAFGNALQRQQQLVDAFPTAAHRQELARSHHNLAMLLQSVGRAQDAERSWRDALQLYHRLAADFFTVPAYRQDLARAHQGLGGLLADTGRPQKAEAAYRDALKLCQQLADDFRTVPAYRQDLATSYNNLGTLLQVTERAPEAERAYRDALKLQQQLAADFPSNPAYRQELARSYHNLGHVLQSTGRGQAAEQAYGDALSLQQQLAADFPTVSDFQNELASTMVNLADLFRSRKEPRRARQLLEQAMSHHQAALKANPGHPEYRRCFSCNRRDLAATLIDLGEHAAAADAAAQLTKAGVDPASDLYEAGCVMSRCVLLAEHDSRLSEAQRKEQARTYADRALATLRQAVQDGCKDVAKFKKNKDLDPLRSRADFQKLVAELEKNVK
jgi:serine/threonine protein kinase/tetratricopeptide (TPR) repeat protein